MSQTISDTPFFIAYGYTDYTGRCVHVFGVAAKSTVVHHGYNCDNPLTKYEYKMRVDITQHAASLEQLRFRAAEYLSRWNRDTHEIACGDRIEVERACSRWVNGE